MRHAEKPRKRAARLTRFMPRAPQAKAVSDPLKKPLSLLCAGLEDVAKYTQGLASGARHSQRVAGSDGSQS